MKQLIQSVLFQMLSDQVTKQIYHLIEWLNTTPWQVWLS